MPLRRLCVRDFRNLDSVEISPSSRLNFIEGVNGSGKTSLLESISTLAMGRSFRSRKHVNVIRHDGEKFLVFAELEQEGQAFRLGFTRDRLGSSIIRLNDRNVRSAAELALNFPLQVINNQAFQLLDGGPTERRHFLDWMVFHVKHSFGAVWADYSRCLKHRNSLLRHHRRDTGGTQELTLWEGMLSGLATQVDEMRSEIVGVFVHMLSSYASQCEFVSEGGIAVEYLRGWKPDRGLLSEMEESRERDLKLGYTSVGPHKAEIKIRIRGHEVAEVLSRGQQKSLVSAMYMAQLGVFRTASSRDCILLVDDLPAELDEYNQALLSGWISKLERTQVFITGIELNRIIKTWPKPLTAGNCKLFHVKQGLVTEKPCDWSNP